MPTELYVLLGGLLLIGSLVGLLVFYARKGAVSQDDLDEAARSAALRRKAEAAALAERKKNEELR